tara:strand:- start:1634 stop:1942 length:309 start_codon:yes stop_codon:yes gene_type:complete
MSGNNLEVLPFAIEFIGTYLYVLANFLTRDPLIIAMAVGLLFLISGYGFGHKGDFNPALSFPKFLSSYYTDKVSAIKIVFQICAGIFAFLTYKIFVYKKDAK